MLSGLGFENGGVSGAHALGVGVTALPDMEKKYLHGEMVALGILTELTMEKREKEREELAAFFTKVGLPVCWKQMGVDVYNKEQVATMLNSCFSKFYAIKNMPFEKSIDVYTRGMQEAEEYCNHVLQEQGQEMWLHYHHYCVCYKQYYFTNQLRLIPISSIHQSTLNKEYKKLVFVLPELRKEEGFSGLR